MKVILSKDVKDVGKKGQAVEVSEGYARNFLLPRSLAVIATEGAVRSIEQEKQAVQRKKEREVEGAQKLAAKLNSTIIRITVRSGEGGKLFGSVTTADIANTLLAQGVQVDKRKIELRESIKLTGTYKVDVRVYQETIATLTLVVTGE
ncbi:MAG: large subunit ribosomal protein L9 [Bacillota bacterium]|nr:MAG: large subunit ribosomal protein L9 [Bacillota bacterium]MBS3951043.1 50S ribosomal protein L9 [Peptococcaceae bacterium]